MDSDAFSPIKRRKNSKQGSAIALEKAVAVGLPELSNLADGDSCGGSCCHASSPRGIGIAQVAASDASFKPRRPPGGKQKRSATISVNRGAVGELCSPRPHRHLQLQHDECQPQYPRRHSEEGFQQNSLAVSPIGRRRGSCPAHPELLVNEKDQNIGDGGWRDWSNAHNHATEANSRIPSAIKEKRQTTHSESLNSENVAVRGIEDEKQDTDDEANERGWIVIKPTKEMQALKRLQWEKQRSEGRFFFRTETEGLVHAVMKSRGWTEVEQQTDGSDTGTLGWDCQWCKVKRAVEILRFARRLLPWQRINHFRNTKELCRKDLMLKNIKKRRAQLLREGFPSEAALHDFIPTTFTMPGEYALFVEDFKTRGGVWIMKPAGSSEGRGIFLLKRLCDVRAWRDQYLSAKDSPQAWKESLAFDRAVALAEKENALLAADLEAQTLANLTNVATGIMIAADGLLTSGAGQSDVVLRQEVHDGVISNVVNDINIVGSGGEVKAVSVQMNGKHEYSSAEHHTTTDTHNAAAIVGENQRTISDTVNTSSSSSSSNSSSSDSNFTGLPGATIPNGGIIEPVQNQIEQAGAVPQGPVSILNTGGKWNSQHGAYVVQRYIANPYLIGGRKFDLRLYVLVTSFKPLTVYMYRNGFARVTQTRYSLHPSTFEDATMHLTNVAVQRRGSAFNSRQGGKLNLKKLKAYMIMQHGIKATDLLFWNIQMTLVRTLVAVERLVISDRAAFELFGYDVMIDSDLKPWLIEVNASPSLGSGTVEDYHLKHQMISEMLDLVDVEGSGEGVTEHTVPLSKGGFDLVYHNGFVSNDPQTTGWSTNLGAVTRNRSKGKKPLNDWSKFPQPVMSSQSANESGETCELVSKGKKKEVTPPRVSADSFHEKYVWRPKYADHEPSDHWCGLQEVEITYPEDCSWRPRGTKNIPRTSNSSRKGSSS